MPDRRAVPTLDRMREIATLLGDPQRTYPVLHLTGTNGKGSTAAMATALLAAMGLSVGTYTSPNLSSVNERLAIRGDPIGDTAFADLLGSLADIEALVSERLTRFELLTAAAFAWFSDEAVDAAVIEVGLGGTWDATNIVDATVAVITNISYDHTEVLGPTLEGIAADKSGIVKAGSRVVIGERDPGLVEVIRGRAEAAGAADLWVAGRDFDCTENRVAVGGRLVTLRTPGGHYPDVLVPLHGPHQGRNAATALAAVEAFFDRPLDPGVVEEAFAQVQVPGRIEVLGRHPLTVVDGAHNVAGMEALARALAEEFSVDGPRVAVIGMLRGRDPLAMVAALGVAGLDTVVTCAPDSPRALTATDVAEAARALGVRAIVGGSVGDALALAEPMVGDDGMLLVAGSLYVVTEAREILLGSERARHDPRPSQ